MNRRSSVVNDVSIVEYEQVRISSWPLTLFVALFYYLTGASCTSLELLEF